MTRDQHGREHHPSGSPASIGGQYARQPAPDAAGELATSPEQPDQRWARIGGQGRPCDHDEAVDAWGENAATITLLLDRIADLHDDAEGLDAVERYGQALGDEDYDAVIQAARQQAWADGPEAGEQADRAIVTASEMTRSLSASLGRRFQAAVAVIATAPADETPSPLLGRLLSPLARIDESPFALNWTMRQNRDEDAINAWEA